jgi:uncharacterized integral membrane protein (TIGR00697 family)
MHPTFAFILIAVVAFSVPLLALRLGREWLIALVPIYLITGNVFAESFFLLFGQLSSLAIPVYATTFLITDTLSEHYGKTEARRAVFVGFTGQILFLAMTLTVTNAPIFADKADAFGSVFAILPRLILGSFVAYAISQLWDVQVFHALKERLPGKRTLWIRNILSTFTSQGIDSVIFITIAFYGVIDNLFGFIMITWGVKVLLALLDTPFIYLTYRIIRMPVADKRVQEVQRQ